MLAPFMTEQRAERISRIVANRTRNVLPIVEVGGWLLLACLPGFAHKLPPCLVLSCPLTNAAHDAKHRWVPPWAYTHTTRPGRVKLRDHIQNCEMHSQPYALCMQGLYDMGNLAAVCRSADAFGMAAVHAINKG